MPCYSPSGVCVLRWKSECHGSLWVCEASGVGGVAIHTQPLPTLGCLWPKPLEARSDCHWALES